MNRTFSPSLISLFKDQPPVFIARKLISAERAVYRLGAKRTIGRERL